MTDIHTDPISTCAFCAATTVALDADIAKAREDALAHDRAILISELRNDIRAFQYLAETAILPAFFRDWADRQIARISATLREVGAS